jgi:hypothetical protein
MSAAATSARPGGPWARAVFFVFVVVLLAIVAFGILDSPTRIYLYRVIDQRTLLVETVSGPGASVRVTDVSETSSTVTITVRSFFIQLGPATAGGTRYESVVKLHDPLGDRTVIDASNGEPVELASGSPPP